MKKSIKSLLYSSTFLLCILSSQAALPEPYLSLSVRVTGGRPNTGEAILSLFSSADNYLKDPVDKLTLALDSKGEALFHIPRLPPGTYAVSVVYDEDKNGKLNTGFLGIPTELVGFSNNAKGRFGPPPFKKTSFQVNRDSTIIITLGKAKK